ncbi:hypothetical protein NA57DRAFT_53937 [Rhizodiscina lignyota]|uniref:IgE-binding protein n=1 Tax=Rhizodiscina lignyota TaxID=1504668 RepID=A0A9P4IJ06_9PEZI|nr:hypothetical protein NA57DRAFT_53937 [Rhizodiscina lignyota]
MKTTLAISAILGLFSFSPVQANYFSVISVRSASLIHLQSINANGGSFWIGKTTTSYCPQAEVSDCPPGNDTVFEGGNDTLGLGTVVPAGQQVYIAPSGILSFSEAHTASFPKGSILTGFSLCPGASFGDLSWEYGLVACPTNGTNGPWQIYGQRADITLPETCLGFDALTYNLTEPGAWQYI